MYSLTLELGLGLEKEGKLKDEIGGSETNAHTFFDNTFVQRASTNKRQRLYGSESSSGIGHPPEKIEETQWRLS